MGILSQNSIKNRAASAIQKMEESLKHSAYEGKHLRSRIAALTLIYGQPIIDQINKVISDKA